MSDPAPRSAVDNVGLTATATAAVPDAAADADAVRRGVAGVVGRGARVRRALLHVAPLLLLLFVVIHTGRIGIDFGQHWDEHLQFRLVARTVKTGVLVPGIYNYPTVSYWLTLGMVLPRLLGHMHDVPRSDLLDDLNTMRSLDRDTAALQKYVLEDKPLFMRVRTLFLVVSSLTLAWVYFLVLAWRRSRGEAFLAAGFLGLSWEFAYHARWIAPDVVMTSFTALTIMLAVFTVLRLGGRRWLTAAAVAAGLAAGTKYQCALLLVPVVVAAAQTRYRTAGRRVFVRLVLRLFAVFGLTFVLTTPGAVLDAERFWNWVHYVATQYKSGDLGGYAVPAGAGHLWRLFVFFGNDFFSVYRPIAWITGAFVVVGVWALFRESRARAWLLVCFPALYLAYMSTQRVLVVRNIVVVSPFLAILAARGACFAMSRLPTRPVRALMAAGLAVMLAFNTVWLYQAAFSIRRSTPQTALKDFATYVAHGDPHRVYATASVRNGLTSVGADLSRLAPQIADAAEVAFYPDDWADFGSRPANLSHLALTWFGPFELNWNYYTTWLGFSRIVLVPAAQAAAMRLRP